MDTSDSAHKHPIDSRHTRRVFLVQQLYAHSFDSKQVNFSYRPELKSEFQDIIANLDFLDSTIKKHASKYPLENVARTDLAILRIAVYELLIAKHEPPKVIINEAVELAKELGSDRSFAFVNGALGAILEDSKQQN